MIKRYPREPKRFPRLITCDDVKSATKKNGTVNLGKIRDINKRRADDRKANAKKTVETKKKHNGLFKVFKNTYKTFLGIEFIPNTRNRIISFYRDDKLITQRRKTDYVRFIEFYKAVNKKYNISSDEFKDYILHVIEMSVIKLEHTKQNVIFGMVVSETISEKYFVRKRRKENRKVDDTRSRHMKYFGD